MKTLLVAISAGCLSLVSINVYAFNVSTHRKMNETAANDDAGFDSFLRTQAAFAYGRNQELGGKKVVDWIIDGGEREDDGTPLPGRFFRHFHDPLRPWSSAGLSHGLFDSSIVWMQEPQEWSWQEARSFYYAALTARGSGARDQQWADAFRAVGQVMHLIEDAAQPAHTRDDQHGMEFVCRSLFRTSCGGNFEYWVSEHASAVPLTGGGGFNQDILSQPTGHSEAPVPVARLIDTDTYDGAFVVLGPSVGIAEFTNANFFSEDTISNVDYPFPSLDSNALIPVTELSVSSFPRQYYAKADGYGFPVELLLAQAVFDEAVSESEPIATVPVRRGILDERVWQIYANTLVPKAVDYAQGALDYFFRGKIDFVADLSAPNTYIIKNLSPEPMSGTFELYYDDIDGNRRLVPGAQWPGLLATQGDMQVTATLPPAGASGKYTLVFHGDMGEEKASNGSLGAVVGKAVRTSSFLLLDTSGFSDGYIGYNGWVSNYWGSTWSAYRSDFVDRGWRRLGGERTYTQAPILSWNRPSCALDDRVAFVWSTGNSLALADGGASVIPTPAGFSSLTEALDTPVSVACLGGSEVLFTFATPETAGVAYSSDLGATAQSRQGYGGGVMTYVGSGTVLLQPGGTTLLRSTDKGLTWSDVDPIFDGETLGASDGLDFHVMAWNHVEGDGGVVLANGSINHAGLQHDDSFWRSTDGGNSWHFLPTTFTDGYALVFNYGFESLAMSRQGEVLASFQAAEGTQGSPTYHTRVVRSLDAGETWQLAALPEPLDNVLSYTTEGVDVGFPYYSVVHASPVVLYWPQ